MLHCDPGMLRQLALVIKFRSRVLDVIRLPLQWWVTHIQVGIFHAIKSTTFILFPGQSKRIQHLHFVSTLDINTTITAALATIFRLIGQAEFNMQVMILKLSLIHI